MFNPYMILFPFIMSIIGCSVFMWFDHRDQGEFRAFMAFMFFVIFAISSVVICANTKG